MEKFHGHSRLDCSGYLFNFDQVHNAESKINGIYQVRKIYIFWVTEIRFRPIDSRFVNLRFKIKQHNTTSIFYINWSAILRTVRHDRKTSTKLSSDLIQDWSHVKCHLHIICFSLLLSFSCIFEICFSSHSLVFSMISLEIVSFMKHILYI